MVNRSRDSKPPSSFLDSKWEPLRIRCVSEANNHTPNKSLYRDTTIDVLSNLYENKCAYCERLRGFELQIDHYRPRKKRDKNTDVVYNQPGYYWLTYEWSNLLPLCSKCNRAKSNKFPIHDESKRVIGHDFSPIESIQHARDLKSLNDFENPLLLHPEYHVNLSRHFKFLNNGQIRGRTIKGKETIKLIDLDRFDLRRERVKILKSIATKINSCMDTYLDNKNKSQLKGGLGVIFKDIAEGTLMSSEYSMLFSYVYHYFEYYIGKYLTSEIIASKAFEYFEQFKKDQKLF